MPGRTGAAATLRLGVVYGLAAFAIGFAFGILREAILIPTLGSAAGTLV